MYFNFRRMCKFNYFSNNFRKSYFENKNIRSCQIRENLLDFFRIPSFKVTAQKNYIDNDLAYNCKSKQSKQFRVDDFVTAYLVSVRILYKAFMN